jgi:hypothetical protein
MTQDTITPDATATEGVVFEDYWGTDETYNYVLPDGHQFFTIQPMDEGAKQRFQKKTNKGIRMNQRSQEATIDVDPADERWTLIKESVVGWKLMQRAKDGTWSEYPFSKQNIERWLEKANPKIVQDLEFFIRTKNPWMQADMDLEQIDEEIDRLEQLRKQVVEQQAGEGSSANK